MLNGATSRGMRFCWADRVTVLWAFLLYLLLFAATTDKMQIFELGVLHDMLFLVVPVWITLRLIHWIFGGHRAR